MDFRVVFERMATTFTSSTRLGLEIKQSHSRLFVVILIQGGSAHVNVGVEIFGLGLAQDGVKLAPLISGLGGRIPIWTIQLVGPIF